MGICEGTRGRSPGGESSTFTRFISFPFLLALLPFYCSSFHSMMSADLAVSGCGDV